MIPLYRSESAAQPSQLTGRYRGTARCVRSVRGSPSAGSGTGTNSASAALHAVFREQPELTEGCLLQPASCSQSGEQTSWVRIAKPLPSPKPLQKIGCHRTQQLRSWRVVRAGPAPLGELQCCPALRKLLSLNLPTRDGVYP